MTLIYRQFSDKIRVRQKISGNEGPYAMHTIASANAVGILGEKHSMVFSNIIDPNIDRILFLMKLYFNNTKYVMYVIYDMTNEEYAPISDIIRSMDHEIVKQHQIISTRSEKRINLNTLDKMILKKAAELYIEKFT